MNGWLLRLLLLWGVCLALGPPIVLADESLPTLKIGVLAVRGMDDAHTNWGPTFDALSQALPQYHFEMVPESLASLTAAVSGHRVDFVITNPGQFFELQVDYGVSSLATVAPMDGTPASQSVASTLIVRADQSRIQTLQDLDGKTVAAVAPEAFGFRMAWREMTEQRVYPFKRTQLMFTGFPSDAVVERVRQGKADAGIIPACLLETLIAKGTVTAGEFRVINSKPSAEWECRTSTRAYPGWPFVRLADTPTAIAQRVAEALLVMQPGQGSFAWIAPEDYQPVQDLYRFLKIGPYDRFKVRGILDFLDENRYGAGLLLMALLWGVAHVFRVEYLIKKRTQELEHAHEEAKIKSEHMEHTARLSLMGEMASSLAHEINQPLAAIINYARGCERRLDNGNDLDGVQQGVKQIAVQAERAGEIVKRMRKFVRKHPSVQIPLDPAVMLHDTLLLYAPTAQTRGIQITDSIPEILPTIRADRLRIEEVLLNLLQNAVDAVAGQEEQKIHVSAIVIDNLLRINVIDNGPGLSPEAQKRLFEAFHTTKPEGLGLGLSLSRTIVEAHGGSLWAEPRTTATGQMQGTVFSFVLPLIQGDHYA